MDGINEESSNQFSLHIYLGWESGCRDLYSFASITMRICILAFCHIRNIKKNIISLSSLLHLLQN